MPKPPQCEHKLDGSSLKILECMIGSAENPDGNVVRLTLHGVCEGCGASAILGATVKPEHVNW